VIEFKHVYKAYGAHEPCLRDVNFKIGEGEFVFLVGPSGSGKTTIFKLISAYESKSSGDISVLGHDLSQLRKGQIPFLRREVGLVLQNYKLLKDKTVFENIELALIIREVPFVERKTRVEKIIDRLGLQNVSDQFPDFLSGGEQQRVAIGRALVGEPRIVIADEPTGNLDPELSLSIMRLFQEFSRQGITFVVATHDYRLIDQNRSRVLQIQGGRIVEGFQK
jgi:cell division transport system ATP-binding protein